MYTKSVIAVLLTSLQTANKAATLAGKIPEGIADTDTVLRNIHVFPIDYISWLEEQGVDCTLLWNAVAIQVSRALEDQILEYV